jgi:SAM-dependent methyltransferase
MAKASVNYNTHSIRHLERTSIRAFVERHRSYLVGEVLDFGAGGETYRDLVQGNYIPYDTYQHKIEPDHPYTPWGIPPDGPFDAILCNQVLQYIVNVPMLLRWWHGHLKSSGTLVCTWPCCWDIVEDYDLWRFTPAGMDILLQEAGFTVLSHERLAAVELGGFRFPLSYGSIAIRI